MQEIVSSQVVNSWNELSDFQPKNIRSSDCSVDEQQLPSALEQQQQQQQVYDISAQSLLQMKADMDASFLNSFRSHLSSLSSSFSLSSSSSDSSSDSAYTAGEEDTGRKKKRKMECFLETLMSQVTHKQEQMHHQLMELIQNKERERIARELEWRSWEMERSKREEDLRSQEAAHSLALISFIRAALGGQELESLPSVFLNKDEADTGTHLGQDNGKRWPTSEVQALITLRAALDHKFHIQLSKAPAWQEVSAGMTAMGFNRSANKCREKWDNINKYYKRATSRGKRRSEKAKTCPYFHELETLFSTQYITTNTDANSQTSNNAELNEASVV